MNRVVVTGAGGFIGASLVRRLLADGDEVHVLLRAASLGWRLSGLEGELVVEVGSVDDRDRVRAVMHRVRPDTVIHLAAHGAYPEQRDLDEMLRTNVRGTIAIVDAAIAEGVRSVAIAGSSSEYGLKDHAPAEDELIEPDSDYAVTKAAGVLYAVKEARRTGVAIHVLRLYSAYGPWEEPTRLIPSLLIRAMEGRYPPLVSPGIARDFVYVDDVVDAFVRTARSMSLPPGTVLNIGSGIQRTIEQVVAAVRSQYDIVDSPVWSTMPDRGWDTNVWVSDPRRAEQLLGWRAATSLDHGLRATAAWLATDLGLLDRYRTRISR